MVIDARDYNARKASGKISGAFLITSDYGDPTKNEFNEKTIFKKFNSKKFKKNLKKRSIAGVTKVSELGQIKYVLFCNGFKCHRSSWAACQLRNYGVPYENITINLGGFSELKDSGAKIK